MKKCSLSLNAMTVFALIFLGCNTAPQNHRGGLQGNFLEVLSAHPEQVWSPSLSLEAKQAIADYRLKKKLPNGEIYGASVRAYDLRDKCFSEIDQEMKKLECKRKEDVLKDPKTKNPLKTGSGKTIPLIVYLCSDGGVVRVKPAGDPTSKLRSQPLTSKALRYPYNSKFDNFDDERVKVDNFGNAIPKWTKDMNPSLVHSKESGDIIEAWADDAHTDLKICSDVP